MRRQKWRQDSARHWFYLIAYVALNRRKTTLFVAIGFIMDTCELGGWQ